MELKASNLAQFFIQEEYYHVAIIENMLFISSNTREERIPFSVWNGEVVVERGLRWGSLTFSSNQINGKSIAWLVQGLPWQACQKFAEFAVESYQSWYQKQCKQLGMVIPLWQGALNLLQKQPSYLPDSEVYAWGHQVTKQLNEMNISIEEARLKMPKAMSTILPWLSDVERLVDERNERWLENERLNWEVLFSRIESSPLNTSQQHAVLLNNDNNLVLAGAGTGKTSVLTARVAYLLQSHLAQPQELLMLAFGKEAVHEMEQRLKDKIGLSTHKVTVSTFHQLGLNIISSVEGKTAQITPYATDEKRRRKWCSEWLKQHWQSSVNLIRWQKHLSKWPIAYLKGDEELFSQSENPKLISWLEKQLDQLCRVCLPKKQLQQQLIDHIEYPRLNSELTLVWPCYLAWQKMLKDNEQIDFHSMITRAIDYVKKGKFCVPWRYIMVDEYQDISPDRVALVKALCTDKTGEVQASLFAVGDDWQSIYHFAGADVDLTTKFAQQFFSSSIHYLDTTYRFNSKIAEVANQFIQKNPNQLNKELLSFRTQKEKSVIVCPTKRIEYELSDLNKNVDKPKSVLILGRNHYDKPKQLSDWKKHFSNLCIEFMTCHASKGKEADYVFILSVDEGHFPAVERQKHLDLVLSESSDDFPFAEERRLFYVALTRAREKVWVTHGSQASSFVNELITENYSVVRKH